MSYEELKKYTDEQKEAGVPEEEIRHALNQKEWAPDLINKALGSDNIEIEESKIPTIKELFVNSWNYFTDNAARLIGVYFILMGIAILSIIILGTPAIYSLSAYHLTVEDIMNSEMAPIFFSYFAFSIVSLILVSSYGQLLQTYIVTDKNMKIKEAMYKSWKNLPSYIWLGILVTLFIIGIGLPGLVIFGLAATPLIPVAFKFVALGAGFLLFLPAIYFAITMIFASFAFVVHGAKGKTAIRESYNAIKNKFWWVLGRIILLWLIVLGVNIISQFIPFLGFILNIIVSPFTVIYLYKLYLSAEYQYQHREELA